MTVRSWLRERFTRPGIEPSGAAILTTSYGLAGNEAVLATQMSTAYEAFGSNSVVFGAMLARMSLFSEATFAFRNLKTKQMTGANVTDGRSLTDLARLEQPWGNATTGELLARMIQDLDLAGNAYIWDTGDELVRLRPDWVTIISELVADPIGRTYRRVMGYYYEPPASVLDEGPPSLFSVDEVAHWCADEETEILTAEGWKDFRSLRTGEEVLTLNHETGLSEWQPVLDVNVFPAQQREMVLMEGREHSSLTTPNHRWATEYRISRSKTYGRRWVTSDTIGPGDRIPVAAYSADLPQEAKWTDALVEVVAWFWTEGRYASGRKPGIKGRGISIAQSTKNVDNLSRIRAALTVLFGPPVEKISKRGPRVEAAPCWREARDGDMVIFRLSANASDIVTEHAPSKVVTTGFLRSLTAAQLDLFIKVSLLADNNGQRHLSQKSQAMAEQFALACLLAGHGVSIHERWPDPASRFGFSTMWNVRMLKKRHVYPQEGKREHAAFKVQRVVHDGHVWCPRTPNGTWLARRKGTVYFTGNSFLPDPWANFRGMSWLTPVLREVQADNTMTAYKIRYLENNASPNLLVRYTQRLGEKSVNNIRERIQARHAGPENAFKTLVLDEGADATIIGNSFEQMNFSTVQAAGENRILLASGVPGIVVGAKEGLSAATYSNYEQAMRRFADITMRPLWRSVCASLSKLVSVPRGSRLWFDISDIAALRQGEKEQADTMLVKAQAVRELVDGHFSADSSVEAINSGDLTLLEYKEPAPQPAPQPPSLPGSADPAAINGNGNAPTTNGTAITNGKAPVAIGAGK